MIKHMMISLAAAAVVSAVPANAVTLRFDMMTKNGSYQNHSTWTQSSTPQVLSYFGTGFAGTPNDLGFTSVVVSNGMQTSSNYGTRSFSAVGFVWGHNDYFHNTSGGVSPVIGGLIQNLAPNVGPPLFSGSVEHPVFAPGVWTSTYGGTNTVTVTAVPEPASWALLIAGFGLTGAAARRRRVVTA